MHSIRSLRIIQDLLKDGGEKDVNCEWPFLNVKDKDIVRFPHAILEIKTQGVGETKPEWIEEIIGSSYVEHVHKFSKFMHGCSVLYPSIGYIPYWLPQIKTDIRKDPYHGIHERKRIVNNKIVDLSGESDNATSANFSPVSDHDKKIAIPVRVEPKVFFAMKEHF